ncbi:MAG: type I polyketide synthase, partial [Pseudomonadota bacterium]
FTEKGIAYGPGFQGIERLMRGEAESLCFLRASETVEAEIPAYRLHPGLFDACLQTAASILPAGSREETQLPVGMKRLRITPGSPGPVLWSHARLRESDNTGQGCELDFCLFDETGLARVQVEGFSVKRASRETLLEGGEGKSGAALYTVAWEPVPFQEETAPEKAELQSGVTGRWVIFADIGGLGEKMAEALRARGADTIRVYRGDSYVHEGNGRYRVNPLAPDDFHRLLENALEGRNCGGILHLWSLDSGNETDAASIEEGKILGCASVLHLLQALSGAAVTPKVWLVTQGAQQAVGPPAQRVSVHQSPLWGFQRVIALEHPEFRSVCIDLDPGEDSIHAEHPLLAELGRSENPDGEEWIAYRGGVRYGARLVRVEQADTGLTERVRSGHNGDAEWPREVRERRIRSDATYLITGGLGALGCLIAERLKHQGAGCIVLSGRNPAGLEVAEKINRLQGDGTRVVVMPCDVSREKEVVNLLERIRTTLPELKGIIHAAGILDDGVIREQAWERFTRVMAPKIDGAWNLHRHSRDRSLDFFILFSSTASGLGSPGQSNYAAANAFLDTMSQEMRQRGCPATTINWGPWDGEGMAASARDGGERYSKQGVRPLVPADGINLFDRILTGDLAQVYAADIDWNLYANHRFSRSPKDKSAGFLIHLLKETAVEKGKAEHQPAIQQKLAEETGEKRITLLRSAVIEAVRKVMDYEDAGRIRTDQALMEQGLDSLMSVELRNILSAGIDMPLPVGLLFDFPSIDDLCRHLAGLLSIKPENAPVEWEHPSIVGENEDEFAYIDEIDPEELEAMIRKEIG